MKEQKDEKEKEKENSKLHIQLLFLKLIFPDFLSLDNGKFIVGHILPSFLILLCSTEQNLDF